MTHTYKFDTGNLYFDKKLRHGQIWLIDYHCYPGQKISKTLKQVSFITLPPLKSFFLQYKWDTPVIQSTNEVSEPKLEPIYVFSVGRMSNWNDFSVVKGIFWQPKKRYEISCVFLFEKKQLIFSYFFGCKKIAKNTFLQPILFFRFKFSVDSVLAFFGFSVLKIGCKQKSNWFCGFRF